MSRDSSCTARNISYVFRVLLGWAQYPSSTSPPLVPLNPSRPSPLLFPYSLMSDVISSQPGMAAASWSNLVLTPTQFLCPRTPHPHSLPEKCWATDQNLANLNALDSIFLLLFFSLYQTAKFRLMLDFCHSNIWCIFYLIGPLSLSLCCT